MKKLKRNGLIAIALFAALAVAVPAVSLAQDGGSNSNTEEMKDGKRKRGKHAKHHRRGKRGHRGKRGLLAHMLIRKADKVGLDDATVKELEAEVDAVKTESEGLMTEMKAAHEEMRTLMQADTIDEAAVLKQVELIGAIKTDLEKIRAKSNIKALGMLSSEQRAELKERMEKRMRKWDKD